MFIKLSALLVMSLLSACSSNDYIDADKFNNQPKTLPDYEIGIGDVLALSVWRNADLSATAVVRPDGKMSSPLIGDTEALGYTPENLAKVIEKKLAKFIRDPEVTISTEGLSSNIYSNRIRVTGAVAKPMSLQFVEGMTVLDVVLDIGGLNDFADASDAILYRQFKGKMMKIPVNIDEILNEGNLKTNFQILPGDILHVPESFF